MFPLTFVCLFVCLAAGLRKNTPQPIFTKFSGNVAHGTGKKGSDFADNLDMDSGPGILTEF